MAANRKKAKSSAERAAQAFRSDKSKSRRKTRAKEIRDFSKGIGRGRQSEHYIAHNKRNRLRRLNEKIKDKDLGIDQRNAYHDRIDVLMRDLGIETRGLN